MALKSTVPPGMVDALCLHCRPNGGLEVTIYEGATACPKCGNEVEPTSLAHMPEDPQMTAELARLDREEGPTALAVLEPPTPQPEATKSKVATAVAVPAPIDRAPAPQQPERITLPESMLDWHADTIRRRDLLALEEAGLVDELKRVRQARKYLDWVLAPVAPPEPARESTPPPLGLVTVVASPAGPPQTDVIAEPSTNGHAKVPAPTSPRWSRKYDRCINPACGTTERPHTAGGAANAVRPTSIGPARSGRPI